MDETAVVVQRFLAAWNGQDGQQIEAVYHEDAERLSPLGSVRGGKAIRAYAERFWRFAPESHHTVPHWAAQGNIVLYELVYEGIHTGPLATSLGDVMGSGRRFHIAGAGVLEIREQRITVERIYFDTAQFLGQLGLGR